MSKKATFKETFRDYLDGKLEFEKSQKIAIFFLFVVLAGLGGWIWEFIFEIINRGGGGVYITGGNILPWINIYAIGGVLVTMLTRKFRKKPLLVFLVSVISTGLLELIGGWLVYQVGGGTRYWDYTDQWWGIGHINGFVCPASAIVFGIGSLFFIYLLAPLSIHISQKFDQRKFLIIITIIFSLVMIDEVTNLALKHLGLPHSIDIYTALGWKPKEV